MNKVMIRIEYFYKKSPFSLRFCTNFVRNKRILFSWHVIAAHFLYFFKQRVACEISRFKRFTSITMMNEIKWKLSDVKKMIKGTITMCLFWKIHAESYKLYLFFLTAIKLEEAKVQKSIKEAAKKGDRDVCTILAKEIIQSRRAVNKIYAAKAQLNSVDMQMKTQLCKCYKILFPIKRFCRFAFCKTIFPC